LLSKELKREKAIKILEKVRIVFHVSPVDERIIDLALTSNFRDFEDAVQYYSAVQIKSDCLITRNKGDFKVDLLPVLTPEEFLSIVKG
jgi:predicted nucleic acid-binding protein